MDETNDSLSFEEEIQLGDELTQLVREKLVLWMPDEEPEQVQQASRVATLTVLNTLAALDRLQETEPEKESRFAGLRAFMNEPVTMSVFFPSLILLFIGVMMVLTLINSAYHRGYGDGLEWMSDLYD